MSTYFRSSSLPRGLETGAYILDFSHYNSHHISPFHSNVLLDEHFNAVLCDLGLATFVCPLKATAAGLVTSTKVKGTFRYMGPEFLEDDGAHCLQSDVWAWGCTVFEVRLVKIISLDSMLKHQNKSYEGVSLMPTLGTVG